MAYHFSRILSDTFSNAENRVVSELKKEGFGVLTEIDVKETLKKKLGVKFRPYKILGACNPHLAYEALKIEDKIGTMMPCNVVIQERSKNNIEVSAVDPVASMMAIENPKLSDIAEEVQTKLHKVIKSL